MDMRTPIRSVVPTLDGPVLAVLARTTRPLTGREIQRLAGTGSVSGVRLALARLVHQGVVTSEQRAAAIFYLANREHLAWPAVDVLADLRRGLIERIRAELASWELPPVHASLFGSAARGDGDVESDIDILVVVPADVGPDNVGWAAQVDELRRRVEAWTGNRCQPFEVDIDRLAEHIRARDPLVEEWRRDAVQLTGIALPTMLGRARAEGHR